MHTHLREYFLCEGFCIHLIQKHYRNEIVSVLVYMTWFSSCVCVFLASGYEWITVMHDIPISSAPIDDILPYPRTQ
jgi:hypothetical protein